jgi:hypothetical protein
MAVSASPSSISTNPNPRDRPVWRSVMIATEWTAPCCSKNPRNSSSVALKGKFPTKSLLDTLPFLPYSACYIATAFAECIAMELPLQFKQ